MTFYNHIFRIFTPSISPFHPLTLTLLSNTFNQRRHNMTSLHRANNYSLDPIPFSLLPIPSTLDPFPSTLFPPNLKHLMLNPMFSQNRSHPRFVRV